MGNWLLTYSDDRIIEEITSPDGSLTYESLSETNKNKRNIALAAIIYDENNYKYLPKSLQSSGSFNAVAVKKNPKIFRCMSKYSKNSMKKPNFIEETTLHYTTNPEDVPFIIQMLAHTDMRYELPFHYLTDPNIALQVIQENVEFIKEYKGEKDTEFYEKALKVCPFAIEYCPSYMKENFDIMKSVVSRCGLLLSHACDKLKSNKELILEAVKENSDAMCHVDENFRNDKVVMMEVVRKQPMALFYASDELKSDLDVVLPAVHLNYQCMLYLPYEFRSTTPVYMASRRMYLGLVFDEKIKNLATINFRF